MQKNQSRITLIFGVLVLGFFVYKIFIEDSELSIKEAEKTRTESIKTERESKASKVSTSLTLNQSQIDYMEKMIKQGYIAYELSSHEVYISPVLWAGMDYKLKQDVTVSCAEYCAMKNGNNLVYIAVFDKQSGKKIAKYSQSWGYEVL